MAAITIELKQGSAMVAKSPLASEAIALDLPKQMGGGGADMSPTDLFGVALGACILVMMQMKAKELGVSIEGSTADVTKAMQLQPELAFTGMHVLIKVPHEIEAGARAKIEEAGRHCPVHRAIGPGVKQDLTFQWGE